MARIFQRAMGQVLAQDDERVRRARRADAIGNFWRLENERNNCWQCGGITYGNGGKERPIYVCEGRAAEICRGCRHTYEAKHGNQYVLRVLKWWITRRGYEHQVLEMDKRIVITKPGYARAVYCRSVYSENYCRSVYMPTEGETGST